MEQLSKTLPQPIEWNGNYSYILHNSGQKLAAKTNNTFIDGKLSTELFRKLIGLIGPNSCFAGPL